ncbi:preprotein translocase subunit SecG [Brevundimonas variabilis]|uniref:Protein-export membrane protein SecG n=1 Tax=Brevundimonas variabilis TaxID=74312 RepID=A0A7W9CKW8_9CAUL|nr:preprotein translocase subunit SecG [Brevundimonas variabilis]MBB5747474.1 preprotein translocase subunit SecG [Brevundimonas variabilis]
MLQTILLVAMILISIALTGVVLIQKSEGGALGMGGGPSGFMTARGAGNLLTKATWVLATMFFLCAIGLTIAGNVERGNRSIIDADAVGSIAVGETAPAAAEPAAPTTTQPAAPAAPSLDDLEASLPAASAPAPAPAQ